MRIEHSQSTELIAYWVGIGLPSTVMLLAITTDFLSFQAAPTFTQVSRLVSCTDNL